MNVACAARSPGSAADADGSVTANLTFIVRGATKPVFESAAYTHGEPRLYFATEPHAVTIHDLRRLPATPRLDREGFEFHPHASQVGDFYSDAEIERMYYPEVQALVAAAVGATRVVVFDVTRRSDAGAGARNRDGQRGPARRVHVDYTTQSGPQRARDVLGAAEVERLLRRGARIVQANVWRPIRGPVQRSPLALADARSVRTEDLVATDQVFPNRVGEIYHLAYHAGQRWYYAPHMRPDEVLLIKGWDSLASVPARFTPHGAFELPDTSATTPARESIEVRTLAVIES
ncbi:MAG TPA: CmcJ/NvfI family oxidoreductase [Rhodanobacteraceae bacterium]|nr:CmcJ/NvfI family oxidoreductase [Rhodanobacteraceae bacterium]